MCAGHPHQQLSAWSGTQIGEGSRTNPFVAGDFLVAAGSWAQAYYMVEKRGLWMEQWLGQSTAWCVKYVFGAEDGGFTACCPAARILSVG